MILSGHLIIETALNNIVSLIFFHPEHIEEGRFRFEQKVRMARAFALRKDRDNVWDLIFAINSLRNDIAHNLTGEKRRLRMERVRDLLLVQPPLSGAIAVKKGSDERSPVMPVHSARVFWRPWRAIDYDSDAILTL